MGELQASTVHYQAAFNYRLAFLNFSCHFPGRLPLVLTGSAEPGDPARVSASPDMILSFDGLEYIPWS